jgi:predicted GNAT superfamily acetyltransferase
VTARAGIDILHLDGAAAVAPDRDLDGLLALNNADAEVLSRLDPAEFRRLLGQAFLAAHIGETALLIAFDQTADYTSPNFLWFRARHDRFVYVDRVVVAPESRGRGHARALYEALFVAARRAGHRRIACEVNEDPPNPASDAFHAALGFEVVGAARLPSGKGVRYFERPL